MDAHCHLDLPAFDADRAAVWARAVAAGVGAAVVAGIEPAGWPAQRALVAANPALRWTAGLHPCWAHTVPLADALAALPAAFEGPDAAVGVGEIGLDRRRAFAPHLDAQRAAFRGQLAVARALDRPVVLHVVRAHGEALDRLRADGLPRAGGMVHSFSGSAEVAQAYVALGLHVSFTGALAHPTAHRARAAAQAVPLSRLLVETDAPDQPLPGAPDRNEPAQLVAVLAALAALRGVSVAALGAATTANAQALFGERPRATPRGPE